MAFLASETTPNMASQDPSSSTTKATKPLTTFEYMTNRRSRKQASLFFLGATFFTLSTLITKRSLLYRRQLSYPLFYKPSNAPLPPINGPAEAFRALQLATFNVASVMLMLSGGLLWAFDISSVDDLRARIKAGTRFGKLKSDLEVQVEFEQWLAEKQKAKDELESKDKAIKSVAEAETSKKR